MHPLVGDITELSDKELSERMQKLMRVMRTGGAFNGAIYQQAVMMYDSYLVERQRRNDKILEEQMKKSGTSFDGIIDIS